MYQAISDGEQPAQAALGEMIAELDPPQKENVALDDVLMAFSFALSLYSEGSILVKALIRTAPQTTGLLGKLFPSGTIDQQVATWQEVSDSLGTVTKAYQSSVAEGLPLLQDDVQVFVRWSQNSGLSGNRPSLNSLSDDMASVLTAYATSRVIGDIGTPISLTNHFIERGELTYIGIIVSRAPGIDVHALQTSGAKLSWDTGCSGGYTNGVCDTFFYDGKDTYGLTDPNHQTKNYHDVLVKLLQGQKPPTTGQLLFSASQACYERTGKNGGNTPTVDPTDPTQLSCVSVMQICTWDENGFGPFDKSCPNLPSKDAALPRFGISGCIGETGDTSSIDVPHAYLGPGIWQDGHGVAAVQDDSFCDNIDV